MIRHHQAFSYEFQDSDEDELDCYQLEEFESDWAGENFNDYLVDSTNAWFQNENDSWQHK